MMLSKTNENKSQTEKIDPIVFRIALVMVFGALAPLLDSTMANVAIKTIASDLKTTVSTIQWIITIYALAMGIIIPISGWAINVFGGKKIYISSLIIFLVGSVFSSLSWNISSLILFRFIQGIGAGLMLPTLQIILVQSAGGQNLGRLMSIISIPALLGPILGPVLGGFIINSLNWRWIFYINIPITITAILLALWKIPKDQLSENKQKLDIIGILLLSPAFTILIYAISQIGSHEGFNNKAVLTPLAIALVLMVIFVIYALRTKNEPVINLHLFESRNFSASTILLFVSGIATNGAMLLLPLYYQQVCNKDVIFAGISLIPQGLGMLLTRSLVGNLTDRIGARKIVTTSIIVTILGTLPFAIADANTNQIILALALLIRGAGLGGLAIPIMASAFEGLNNEQVPHASIATRILQTIGGAFGSAILATILEHYLSINNISNIQVVTKAYNTSFMWSIVFTAAAIVPSLLLPVKKELN